MRTVILRHEKEKIGFGWIKNRPNGINPRIGNGTCRETSFRIGVIGPGPVQILSREISIKILYSIDDRRVAFEPHPFFQAV